MRSSSRQVSSATLALCGVPAPATSSSAAAPFVSPPRKSLALILALASARRSVTISIRVLLAARLLARVGVEGADRHHRFLARWRQVRDVEAKGRVAADVLAHRLAVHPHLRLPIDGSEDEPGPLALPGGGHADPALIPGHAPVVGPLDATELRLPGKGHDDLLAQLVVGLGPAGLLAGVVGVELEGPRPVEIRPLLAAQVGPGVLGMRHRPCRDRRGGERAGQHQHGHPGRHGCLRFGVACPRTRRRGYTCSRVRARWADGRLASAAEALTRRALWPLSKERLAQRPAGRYLLRVQAGRRGSPCGWR